MKANAPGLALRFLAGRLEGGVVPLEPGCTLLIGRQPGSDVLLTEDLVSRRHATASIVDGELMVEDLGSTNGTFVNGARVHRARVAQGDRVLIGESIFTVVSREPLRRPDATEVRTLIERAIAAAEPEQGSAIQGKLDEVRLHDVLQLLAMARKTGVLAVRRQDLSAEVRLHRGAVVGCSLDGRAELSPEKVAFRILEWASGEFQLLPWRGQEDPAPTPVSESMDALLMEAARQGDELKRVRRELPDRLAPGAGPSSAAALDEDDRALLALVARLGDLDAILDATPLPDLLAAERIATLQARGIVVPAAGPGATRRGGEPGADPAGEGRRAARPGTVRDTGDRGPSP